MPTPFVRDVSADQFDSVVLERSYQVPILVDFWAAWCGPCRILGPVLERLAEEFDGAFELAKVDTEANQQLAARYQIRGIPAVKLFVDGAVSDEFVGALPESAVRDFLRKNCPSEADRLVQEAIARAAAGDGETAAAKLEAALARDPKLPRAHLELARLALVGGDRALVARHLDAIPLSADEAEPASRLREALALAAECERGGGERSCRGRLEANPDDLDARFELGACLVAAGRYREALEELLAVVAKNKRHREEAARKAMLTVFGLVGVRSELANEFRDRLSIYI